jgi:hypothetical protein
MQTINGRAKLANALTQRLGHARGVEIGQQNQKAAMSQRSMEPLPPMDPELINKMMQDVGLGEQGIRASTGRDIRR